MEADLRAGVRKMQRTRIIPAVVGLLLLLLLTTGYAQSVMTREEEQVRVQ